MRRITRDQLRQRHGSRDDAAHYGDCDLLGRPAARCDAHGRHGRAGPAGAAERVAAYVEAGADELGFAVDGGDYLRQVELIAEIRSRL
ncbi:MULTISPECIES: hypothetical protein [Actinoalloteichus]|uniref:Uncharacterized protein n=1 Tax=Actinoalloteichus fjordicus TaxID=1612552 RepID=A0AAC9LCN4_9PSEU|nr:MULTISPECIES: hypothetical protein [Actinoalloteichus]APU14876.1 hypothetical protein UA74_14090 [Actinoalloteichus fjordicus]APU20845.1 hypothetical protein UA75_14175 [Actinoalloteichus sp. GBA129-24]